MNDEKKSSLSESLGFTRRQKEMQVLLADLYSNDYLDIDDYERHTVTLQNISSNKELDAFIATMPKEYQNIELQRQEDLTPIKVTGSSLRLTKEQLSSRSVDIVATGSTLRLDYSLLLLPFQKYTVRLKSDGSVLRILVPPDVEIINKLDMNASVFKNRYKRRGRLSTKTVIELVGVANGSVIKIRKKKRRRDLIKNLDKYSL